MGDISKEWPTHLPKNKQNNIKKDCDQSQTLTVTDDLLYDLSFFFLLNLQYPSMFSVRVHVPTLDEVRS
jgi:hypothetical protein